MLSGYSEKLGRSQAVFFITYTKLKVKDLDAMRAKARDAGGELHVVKNSLFTRALKENGVDAADFEGTVLAGFAYSDAPAMAKVMTDFTVKSEIMKVTGGYLGVQKLSAADVKSLGELPPLPVMRAKLLGLFNTPASQLVRTLAEPARRVAAVVKGYSEKDAAPVAA
jgi:large subunit ribosomal protein L10